jgi:phosphate uptake regulator
MKDMDSTRALFDGLKATTAALVAAGLASDQAIAASHEAMVSSRGAIRELQRAGAEVTKMADAVLSAHDEREDLRESVHRLEGLVIQLSTEVRELRDRPNP